MIIPKCTLLFVLILTLLSDPILGKRGFGGSHSYPKYGGGGHSYPSSGGSHGYPSSGGSHSYPCSGGSHSYPSSGNSGGIFGSGHGSLSNNNVKHTTTVHHHYHYSPPRQITYPSHGGGPSNYPVYRSTPPTYVYMFKDSGSKYGTLLAGLALMNLGILEVTTSAAQLAHRNQGFGYSYNYYKPQPSEVCKFAVKKENGDYEETRIDCQIISGFIMVQDMKTQKFTTQYSTVTPTPNVMYSMLSNGTLVPVIVPGINMPGDVVNINQTGPAPANSGSSSVVVTTTTTNTTLVSALDVKGKPVEVTPGMQCFVIRHSPISNMRNTMPCGLLQTYADKSLQRNSEDKYVPMSTFLGTIIKFYVTN